MTTPTAWTLYTTAASKTMQGGINWAATTLKVALLGTGYTPATTDSTWSAISSNESSGTGYTAGGCTVTSAAVATSGSTVNATGTITGWATATVNAAVAVLYDSATGNLLASSVLNAGAVIGSYNGPFTLGSYTVAVTHTP